MTAMAARIRRQLSQFLRPNDISTLPRTNWDQGNCGETKISAKWCEFYDTWYRPERSILVITGNVDVGGY